MALLFSAPLKSQPADTGAILVNVTPDHADWVYVAGQPAIFTIEVLRGGKPFLQSNVHIEIGPEKMPPTYKTDTLLGTGKATIRVNGLKQPGFLRCTVTANEDSKSYKAMATAAYDPLSIAPTVQLPADFNSFWQKALSDNSKIPMQPTMRLLPERSTGQLDVYEVSFQNFRPNARIYGILCKPKKAGKYPAVLKVPGAGVRPYYGDTALANKGMITLEIGIHGVPVTMPLQVYYDLAAGALNEYYSFNLNNRDKYYYKRVYLGCVRSIDFLASLPDTDTSRIAVYGGSQGGALSFVTAALDKRIKYVAALYPALSDMTGYFHDRAGGWPHMFSPGAAASFKTPDAIENAAYFDVVNFARVIAIPGLYSWGYNDEVCPPTTSYAAYNSLKAPKQLFITKQSGHWLTPEQSVKISGWLVQKLLPTP